MSLLPQEPSRPKTNISDFNIIVYGMPKIGKTTLASKFPKAVFLATEDGQNAIECFRVGIDSWNTFLDACGELKEGEHGFETIILDTLDNLWVLCQRHVCDKRNIEHESELAYGLGSELVRAEFFRALNKLAMLPYGLVMISHAVVREISTRTGKIDRTMPSFKEKEQSKLLGMADFILYCDLLTAPGPDGKPETRRVIRTKTSESYVSGDRTGRLPDPMPLDYAVFREEFDAAVAAHAASVGGTGSNGNPAPAARTQPAAPVPPKPTAPRPIPPKPQAPAAAPNSQRPQSAQRPQSTQSAQTPQTARKEA